MFDFLIVNGVNSVPNSDEVIKGLNQEGNSEDV